MTAEPLCYEGEEWKPVRDPRFRENLEASNYGRVRRLARTYTRRGRPGVQPYQTTRATRLAEVFFRGEYPFVNVLYVSGKRMGCAVHILVCCAWHGARPTERHEVAHADGIPPNVTPGNLRWALPVENEADKVGHGTRVQGVACHLAVLNDDLVREMRASFNGNYAELARRFNVARSTATSVVKRKNWKHVV